MAKKRKATTKERERHKQILSALVNSLAEALTNPKPGPLDKGLPFYVSEDGTVAIVATDEEMVRESIHIANTREIRGGLMALKLREVMTANGLWSRYVVASLTAGAKPLGKTTPEQQKEILSLFSSERSTRCGQ